MSGLIYRAIPIVVAAGQRISQVVLESPVSERAAQVLVRSGDPLQKAVKIAGDEIALSEQAVNRASVAMPAVSRVVANPAAQAAEQAAAKNAGNVVSKVVPRTTEVFKAAGKKAGESVKAASKGKPTTATGKCQKQMFAEKIAAQKEAAKQVAQKVAAKNKELLEKAAEKRLHQEMLKRLEDSERLLDSMKRPYLY